MSAPLLGVIDMQDVFRDAASPWRTPAFDRARSGVDPLLEAFGDRSVFTRFVPPDEMPGSWGQYYDVFADVLRADRAHWWNLTDPYGARADDVVTRSSFTAWGERLRQLAGEPATIVLCGVATDCCVISTALSAVEDGAFVRVVEDACGGSSDASHHAAIAVMRGYAPQIEISTVDRELDRLRSEVA